MSERLSGDGAQRVTVRIRRGAAGEAPRFDDFAVPFEPGMSVLDAILWIRAHEDCSVAFRYSCVNANACKECMVLVDGKVEYACTARLKPEGVTVEPLVAFSEALADLFGHWRERASQDAAESFLVELARQLGPP